MYNRILLPLDGSNMAECTLGHIKDMAAGTRIGEVILLTALEPVLNTYFWPSNESQVKEATSEIEKTRLQNRQKAEEYLSRTGQELRLAGLGVQTVIVEEKEGQNAADIILDYAQNNDIDLIVMSTHGRSGATRWALGSVTDKVIRSSMVPVLIAAPKGCRSPEAPAYYAKL
jgi:nucleotide-binding universal stress UspA family protein